MGLFKYVQDTRSEMKHVAWPTQRQTTVFTALVVAVSIATALYLGFFDFVFTKAVESVVGAPAQTSTATSTDSSTSTPALDLPAGLQFSAEAVDENGAPADVTTETIE